MLTIRHALLPLALLAATASADPNPCGPPPPPTTTVAACATTGDVAVEIDHNALSGSKLPTSITKLYDSRGWTFVETLGDGKPGRSLSGCFSLDDAAKLKAVEDAAWKITRPRVHCMAMGQTSVAFHVHGKADYTQRTCGDASLDDKSAAALADLSNAADAAVDTASHHPPCCKK